MGSKILLADDSITIQKVVNLTFADEGIEVFTVSNGDLAERRLAEINPDLVLADIFMPGKNGYELCECIKETPQFRHIPVVLLVGAFEPFDQNEARRVRADAHLTKPFESRTLVETVQKLIQTSKANAPRVAPPKKEPDSVPDTRPLPPLPLPAVEPSGFALDLSSLDTGPLPPIAQSFQAPESATLQYTPPRDAPVVDYNQGWQGQDHNQPGSNGGSIEFNPQSQVAMPHTGITTEPGSLHGSDTAAGAPSSAFGSDVLEVPEAARDWRSGESPTASQGFDIPSFEVGGTDSAGRTAQDRGFGIPSAFQNQSQPIDFDLGAAPGPISPPAGDAAPFQVSFGDAAPGPLSFGDGAPGSVSFGVPEEVKTPTGPLTGQGFHARVTTGSLGSSSTAVQEPVELPGADSSATPEAQSSWSSAPEQSTSWAATPDSPSSWTATPEASKSWNDTAPSTLSFGGGGADVSVPVGLPVPPEVPASSQALVEDDPLGDVLSDASTSQLAGDAGVHVHEAVYSNASDGPDLGFDIVPVTAHTGDSEEAATAESTAGSRDAGFGSFAGSTEPVSHADESGESIRVNPDYSVSESHSSPVEATSGGSDERFTSSQMWSEVQTSFTPIDVPDTAHGLRGSSFGDFRAATGGNAHPENGFDASSHAAESGFDVSGHGAETGPESGFAIIREAARPADGKSRGGFGAGTGDSDQASAQAAASLQPGYSSANSGALSQEAIQEIVRAVLKELTDSVVREIAWEIVPDCVERVVDRLARESLAKRA